MVLSQANKPIGSARCGRCGRVLTDPKSIARGIGPECLQHLRNEILQEQALHGGGMDRFFESPQVSEDEPEWLCEDCGTPTPQSQLIRGRCRSCHTEREIARKLARDKERELPVVAGTFSEV